MTNKLAIAVAAFAFSSLANADCLGLARGITQQCLADTGDGKIAVLYAQNQQCTASRVRDISKSWRSFNSAVDSLNTEAIKAAASDVHHQTATRSKMFTNCWKTMKNSCQVLGDTVDTSIKAISAGQC
jgi:hypothetical protein